MSRRTNISVVSTNELENCVPTACSKTHTRSSRYRLISTKDVVEALAENGFVITETANVNSQEGSKHGKHLIRLTHSENLNLMKNEDIRHDLILSSSHNGMASFKGTLGVFRYVCSNGLIACDGENDTDGYSVKFRHNNPDFTIGSIVDSVLALLNRREELQAAINEMKSIKLTEKEVRDFARAATFIRVNTINENTPPDKLAKYDLGAIVQRNREEDVEDNLWNVFNAAQENGTKGGVKLTMPRTVGGKILRPIFCPETLLFFNQHLWALAEKYRRSKVSV